MHGNVHVMFWNIYVSNGVKIIAEYYTSTLSVTSLSQTRYDNVHVIIVN